MNMQMKGFDELDELYKTENGLAKPASKEASPSNLSSKSRT